MLRHSTELPKDFALCSGVGCEERERCERFLQRDSRGKKARVPVASLKGPKSTECMWFIERREDER